MIDANDNICPRCGGDIPNTLYKGKYPGALSRVDNKTEICSACGTAEAFEGLSRHLAGKQDAAFGGWLNPPKPAPEA